MIETLALFGLGAAYLTGCAASAVVCVKQGTELFHDRHRDAPLWVRRVALSIGSAAVVTGWPLAMVYHWVVDFWES